MLMHYQRQIVGYHGCLVERYEAALLHGTHLGASADPNDCLGQGIYFWEHGPRRALQWARAHAKRRISTAERPPSSVAARPQRALSRWCSASALVYCAA